MRLKDSVGVLTDRRSSGRQGVEEVCVRQLYHQEIRSLIEELNLLLPTYRKQLGDRTYALARDNLSVLASCYDSNVLDVCALEVLLEHLLTLSHMFTHRLSPDQ